MTLPISQLNKHRIPLINRRYHAAILVKRPFGMPAAFPAIKLPLEELANSVEPEIVPVEAVYQLGQAPTGSDKPNEAGRRRLEQREGATALLRHSVATRLFRMISRRHEISPEGCGKNLHVPDSLSAPAGSLPAMAELLNPVSCEHNSCVVGIIDFSTLRLKLKATRVCREPLGYISEDP
jgi:hypothetical protein